MSKKMPNGTPDVPADLGADLRGRCHCFGEGTEYDDRSEVAYLSVRRKTNFAETLRLGSLLRPETGMNTSRNEESYPQLKVTCNYHRSERRPKIAGGVGPGFR